jgi:hypothetical protein
VAQRLDEKQHEDRQRHARHDQRRAACGGTPREWIKMDGMILHKKRRSGEALLKSAATDGRFLIFAFKDECTN